jgi:hypothetical protein
MKMIISSLATLIFITSSLSSIADTSDVTFIGKPLAKKNIELPACIPLTQEIGRKKTQLRDPNKVWPKINLENEVLSSSKQYKTLLQCLEGTASYTDRFTSEHLAALGEGSLAAGMPMEFALMILGPPNQPPAVMGYMNPLTGKPETVKTYTWMNIFGRSSGLQTFFSILGASALGVAAVTSNVNTALDSLVIASTANLTKWRLGDFSRARVVVIQVDESNQIKMFTAM